MLRGSTWIGLIARETSEAQVTKSNANLAAIIFFFVAKDDSRNSQPKSESEKVGLSMLNLTL